MSVFDFNSLQDLGHSFSTLMWKGVADVHGTRSHTKGTKLQKGSWYRLPLKEVHLFSWSFVPFCG